MVAQEGGGKARRSIRAPAMPKHSAKGYQTRIGHMEAAHNSRQPLDPGTAEWLGSISDDLHARIARAGLCLARAGRCETRPEQGQPKGTQPATLGAFIDSYIDGRKDAKPNTVRNMRRARTQLVAFFGADRPLDSIKPGDADDWYQSMVGKKYAPATIGRDVKRARQFYIAAMRRGLVESNPFQDVKAPGQTNRGRDCFVSQETTQRVIEACPDVQWRCIVALSRYGGIRCPSELLALTWRDIDWERNRFRVHSSKTEHHEGKGVRWVPLFPELRPYLEEAFEQADPGDVHVITRYRESNLNLRTQLLRIIDRAGVEEWPKPFQNMRATRETELCQTFPLHVVCSWLGNSTTIAAKHYLQVTDEHFAKASGGYLPAADCPEALQNALHSSQAASCHNQNGPAQSEEGQVLRHDAADCGIYCTSVPVPPRGIEPLFSD